jgi:hypothetical protein
LSRLLSPITGSASPFSMAWSSLQRWKERERNKESAKSSVIIIISSVKYVRQQSSMSLFATLHSPAGAGGSRRNANRQKKLVWPDLLKKQFNFRQTLIVQKSSTLKKIPKTINILSNRALVRYYTVASRNFDLHSCNMAFMQKQKYESRFLRRTIFSLTTSVQT